MPREPILYDTASLPLHVIVPDSPPITRGQPAYLPVLDRRGRTARLFFLPPGLKTRHPRECPRRETSGGEPVATIVYASPLHRALSVTIRNPGAPVPLRNDTLNGNHWLKVTLEGRPPLHIDGIASRVHVTMGGVAQIRGITLVK